MEVHFKFRNSVSKLARKGLAEELTEQGAEAVRPIFSDEKDPELAALYRLDCSSKQRLRRLLKLLEDTPDVEFAEEGFTRKLVR